MLYLILSGVQSVPNNLENLVKLNIFYNNNMDFNMNITLLY